MRSGLTSAVHTTVCTTSVLLSYHAQCVHRSIVTAPYGSVLAFQDIWLDLLNLIANYRTRHSEVSDSPGAL